MPVFFGGDALASALEREMLEEFAGGKEDVANSNDNHVPGGSREGGRFDVGVYTAEKQEHILAEVLVDAKAGRMTKGRVFGRVSDKAVRMAGEQGVDIQGCAKFCEPSHARHMDNTHGDGERRAGQRPVRPSDFLQIHKVMDDPDRVAKAELKGRHGEVRLFFEKQMDGNSKATVEVRPGSRRLAFISMRIHEP